ncbi:sensor histidine kinase [Hyella patelloides]|uniref:sensor histidine kinase n=1 Tax=Hyella patelloides TaxID=1982969 RepID=UPI00164376E8|nr:sensor histidine kinase [Hyella patelloides]
MPWLFWVCAISFGIMGLRLPSEDAWDKILYTAIEFILAILASHFLFWDHISSAPILLILTIRSCLIFSRIGQLIIAGITWICFISNVFLTDWVFSDEVSIILPSDELANVESLPPEIFDLESTSQNFDADILQIQLQNILLFTLILVFVYLLINTLISERQNRRKLAHAHAQLYEYAAKIENQATLQERNRIAREIHDSLGHLLTAQSIQLDNGLLSIKSDLEQAETFFQTSKQIVTKALKELRQSVNTLRSAPLQEQSLELAISNLVENYQQITGIAIDYKIDLHFPISSEISTAVFRILEEALTNIYKHSGATTVRVVLQTELSNNKLPTLWFKIEDNGRGFCVEQNTMGFGLQSMQGRTSDLGGKLRIVSQIDQGCQVLGSFSLRGI